MSAESGASSGDEASEQPRVVEDTPAVSQVKLIREATQRESHGKDIWAVATFDFEARYKHLLEKERALPCNHFPASDIEVKRVAKPVVSGSSVMPTDESLLSASVRAFFKFCSRPWVLLERHHMQFKGVAVEALSSLPSRTYELDAREGAAKAVSSTNLVSSAKHRRTPADKVMLPEYLSPHLSALYNPQWDWCRGVALMLADRNYARLGDPNASKVFQRPEALAFLVQPGAPSFGVPSSEPFFCSLALYHIKDRVKISETFHYAVVDGVFEDPFSSSVALKGELLSQRACIFSAPVTSQYIHLVLEVTRVLQGDEEKSAEPFCEAPSSALSKVLGKLGSAKDLSSDFYARLGVFEQTFCVGSIPVFDAAGKFLLNEKSVIDSLWFRGPGADFPFFECLMGTYSKRKAIQGSCTVSARRITGKDFVPHRLDVALAPYATEAGVLPSVENGEPGYIRDMADLVSSSKPCPNLSYFGSLFLAPASLSLATRKSLCVRIEMRASDDDSVLVPLKSVFCKHGGARSILGSTARATVAYGTKNPTWLFEEFRVHLPPKLSHKHHIMFFFSEVDVEAARKKRNDAAVETLLGVSMLRIVRNGSIVGGVAGATLRLPIVSVEQPLPRGYLALFEADNLPMLDGGKEMFEVRAHGFSATIPSEPSMAALFQFFDNARIETSNFAPDTVATMLALRELDVGVLVSHLPLLANALIRVICCNHAADLSLQALQTLVLLFARVHEVEKQPRQKRAGLVYQFIEFGFEPLEDWAPSLLVPHYGIAVQYMTLCLLMIKKPGSMVVSLSTLFTTSWMLFDLMFKSATFASESKEAKVPERLKRHPADFARILKKLYSAQRSLLALACEKHQDLLGEAADLSCNMSLFLSEMLSIYDRGILGDLFVAHLQETRETITNLMGAVGGWKASSALSTMLLDFAKIFADNEHFVPLNVPKHFHITSAPQLCEQVEGKHPVVAAVVGLVLDELLNNANPPPMMVMAAGGAGGTTTTTAGPKGPHKAPNRSMALSLLANLITKIDRDPRFVGTEDRHAIAVMFSPLVFRLLRIWKGLEKWRQATADAQFIHEKQELGIAVIWVLRNVKREWLQQWWKGVPDLFDKGTFVSLLEEMAVTFKYQRNMSDLSTPHCTVSQNVESLVDLQQAGGLEKIQKNRRRLGVHGVTAQQTEASGTAEQGSEALNKRMGALAHDVGLLLLSLVGDLMDDFAAAARGQRGKSSAAGRQLAGLLQCLVDVHVCAELAPSLFVLLYKWASRQGAGLFRMLETETERLIESLMRMCGFSCEALRTEAASFMYFLLTQCEALLGSIDVVKRAAISACSRLAESNPDFGSRGQLKSALRAVSDWAMQDYMTPVLVRGGASVTRGFSRSGQKSPRDDEAAVVAPSSSSSKGWGAAEQDLASLLEDESPESGSQKKLLFARRIQDLTLWLEKIVNDTAEIVRSSSSKDVEILADSYWRIAESYRQSPDLRLEWLEKLAQFHAKNGDFSEAAITMLHSVALISDYLNSHTETKVDTAVFKRVCPTIAEFYDDESAAQGSNNFTLRHWKFAIKATLKFMEQAEYFEMANDLYRLLLPVYHGEGGFRELGNSHTQLETMFVRLAQNDSGRLLGRYFRVAFFGALFGHLNGKEFVYKEKLLTHLFSLKERLCEHYDAVLGSGKIEVLDHGGTVDVSALDPNKGYLQITAVRPYWGEEEEATRVTFFQRNSMLQQFAFETPMTVSGKVGQVGTADQYMRRTILTTQVSFPYVLKRVLVRSRREMVVTPIEIAIESMQARVEKLQGEIDRKPPDSKTLQQVLQGSVLTTVNRGTIEYLEIFLAQASKYEKRHVKMLQSKFRLFFDAAKGALALNQSIIEASQQEFHDEMTNGYRELLKLAEPLVYEADEMDMEGSSVTDSGMLSARGPGSAESPIVPRGGGSSKSGSPIVPRAESAGLPPAELPRRRTTSRVAMHSPRAPMHSPRTSSSRLRGVPTATTDSSGGASAAGKRSASPRTSRANSPRANSPRDDDEL